MSTYMTIWLFAAGVIIIVMFLLGRRFKNSTLDKLPLLSGEKILFEDEAKKVLEQTGPRPMIFPRCFVRLTSQRIIIAQHTLFGGKSARLPIRYIIYFDKRPDAAGYGGGALKTGYVTFVTAKDKIKTGSDREKKYLEIQPSETPGRTTGVPFYMKIFTERGEEFLRSLR